MSVAIEDLTMGEIDQLETLTGLSMAEIGDPKTPKAKFLTAYAYLVKHREDTTFTYNQAEAMTLAEVNSITGGDASPESKSTS